jgi:hypothetical protein
MKKKKYWSLYGIKNQYILIFFLKMNLCDFFLRGEEEPTF